MPRCTCSISWPTLSFLADLFDRHRGRSYEKQISFADLVYLLADSLVLNGQSAHRTFQQARANGEMSASVKAAYDKIARLPIELSVALLTEGSARLRDLLPESLSEPVPASLAAFTPLGFDGKKIKYVARRLRPVRSVARPSDRRQNPGGRRRADRLGRGHGSGPGWRSVGPDLGSRTADANAGGGRRAAAVGRRPIVLRLDPFAHAGGRRRPLRRPLLRQGGIPSGPGKADENRDATSRGQPYTEEWGWLGGPDDERRLYVRRITVHRPDDEDVLVVTDLVDGETYPAADILDMYLRRWGIERLFQKVTEVFHLQALVSARENGTVFQAALCLLLYNLTVVVRAHVAEGAKRTDGRRVDGEAVRGYLSANDRHRGNPRDAGGGGALCRWDMDRGATADLPQRGVGWHVAGLVEEVAATQKEQTDADGIPEGWS